MSDAMPSTDHFWEDPDENIKGVLLSDAIAYYIEKARLIENYDPQCIKSGSYALRLRARYYQNGRFGNLKEGGTLILKRNSLTFVSMLERVNIPLYMIARFNLKIDLIYKGIILGTGPQVDPGFRGNLSCPLHNISNNDVEIRFEERFATIDFLKTSKFPSPKDLPELSGLNTQSLYERYGEQGIPGYNGKRVVLFPKEKLERNILDKYIAPGMTVKSSLKDFEDTIKRTKRLNIGIAIALATVLLTLAIGGTHLWWNQFEYFKTLRDSLDQQITRNSLLNDIRERMEQKINDLEAKVSEVEDSLIKLGAKPSEKSTPRGPQVLRETN